MGLVGAVKEKAAKAALSLALAYIRSDKEYGPVFAKVVKFFNHKAMISGAALAALPKLAAVVAGAMIANGFEPSQAAYYTAWGGGAVLVVGGIIHRIVKWADDQTPD
jgi:hypothetical protein